MSQAPTRYNPNMPQDLDAFELNGGLDLIAPKIQAPKGSMLDCLNREVIDRIGYKTIDGLDRYDGRTTPAQEDVFMLYNTSYGSGVTTDFAAGDCLVITGTTNIFGVVVGSTYTDVTGTFSRIYYARVNKDYEPKFVSGVTSDTVSVITEAQAFAPLSGIFPLSGADPVTGVTPTPDAIVDSLNTYAASLRSRIEALRDTPIGLHWYRDKLYAVVNEATVYFTQVSGQTTAIVTNSLLSKDAGASTARVLSVELQDGTAWADEDAAGTMQIEVLTGTWGTSGTVSVTAPTNSTTITLRAAAATDPDPEYATLWKSRSEQQAVTDGDAVADAGWVRIDHGWEADFTDGFSETGGFVVVQRGKDNNFAFVDSSESGVQGVIKNGTNLVGVPFAPASSLYTLPPMVSTVNSGSPGWKTTTSATAYATADELATAVAAVGGTSAYANIYYFMGGGLGGPAGRGQLTAFDQKITAATAPEAAPSTIGTETFDTDFWSTQARAPIFLSDFSTIADQMEDGSLISGIEVTISYTSQNYAFCLFQTSRNSDVSGNTVDWVNGNLQWGAAFCTSPDGNVCTPDGVVQYTPIAIATSGYQTATVGTTQTEIAKTLTGQSATIGGASNTFSVSNLTKQSLYDKSKGIALFGQVSGSPFYPLDPPVDDVSASQQEYVRGVVRLKVDKIVVKFYYTTPSARYYVGDGAGNVCSIDMVYYAQTDGTFAAATATGKIQFTNIVPDVTDTKRTVESGDTLHLTAAAAAAGTNPVATLDSDADYNGFPSLERLVEDGSRYQFITANFFGRDQWDGFYGVSGAGRAFSFATFEADPNVAGDEDYIIQMYTNVDDIAGDKPRHIAFHHYSLALGYSAGIVRFSVPGEPENFNGLEGAAEIGVGDKVTGLLSMKGMTLGVFCENSIWGIAGTDADNFTTQVLAPYTGALEYTVVDMGIPVYCDSRGVSTLEQSAAYGNFVGSRLSKPVTPWIIPRMVRNSDLFSVANGSGVVCAIPVRAKNQYRVFFKDGYVLVMTINPDSGPVFTYSRYYIGQSVITETEKFLVPFAWSSQVDDNGVERIHVSHYSPLSDISAANGKYAYELDEGWSFAGNFIPAEYVLNWYFKNPFQDATIKKMRIDGLTKGVSSCKVYTAKEYDETFSTLGIDASITKDTYSTDFKPATKMCNATVRGRNVTIKVKNEFRSGDAITDPIPADVHQIMLIQTDAGGKPDA